MLCKFAKGLLAWSFSCRMSQFQHSVGGFDQRSEIYKYSKYDVEYGIIVHNIGLK